MKCVPAVDQLREHPELEGTLEVRKVVDRDSALSIHEDFWLFEYGQQKSCTLAISQLVV